MSNDNNIKSFTAIDIEKYHKGQLTAKEMHALEKAALDDPFLADALEGYSIEGVNVKADIDELKGRLSRKTGEARVIPMHASTRQSFPWLRIAVMLVVIATAGFLSYQFFVKDSPSNGEIAQSPQAKETKTDTISGSTQEVAQPSTNGTTLEYLDVAKDSTNLSSAQPISGETDGKFNTPEFKASIPDTAVANDGLSTDFNNNRPRDVTIGATSPAKIEDQQKQELEKKLVKTDNNADKNVFADRENAKSKIADRQAQNEEAFSRTQNAVNAKGITNNARNNQANRSNNFFKGTVTDANNNPLPFANITNTDDNVGTYTDARGNFTLVSPYDSVLNVQVRALGFENNRLQLRSDMNANQVTLQEDRSVTAKVLDTVKRNYVRSRDNSLSFEEPEPADGWNSYDVYLSNNLKEIPEALDIKKNTGSDAVELSFEVNKNGDPVNIRVEKSLCDKCDKEAIRLVKEGPKWKRKAKKGKRTTVTVPFVKPE